jgi:antitoxin ParD1/3/4
LYIFAEIVSAQPETAMNVKISIELPKRQLEFAERKVREGAYASVSEVIAESLQDTMLAEHENMDRDDPVLAMKDEIRRRLELPDDQWIRMDENDTMFEDLRAHIKKQIENGR